MDLADASPAPPGQTAGAHSEPWGRPLVAELLESLPDPVIGTDAQGVIVHWSRAARDIYGFAPGEAIGRPMLGLLRSRTPAPAAEIQAQMTDLGQWEGTIIHRAKDGRRHEVESRWTARYDDAGKLVGWFAIERPRRADRRGGRERRTAGTEAESVADSMARAERLESVGQIAAGIAHDFNNALAIIINYSAFVSAELERLRPAPAEAQRAAMRADLDEVQAAAQRAGVLNQELLAFSRQGRRLPATLDLNDEIRDARELLARTAGEHIDVQLRLAGWVHPVLADPGEIQQALVNLTANARDAMPTGGTLTIDTANVTLERGSDAGAAFAAGVRAGSYVRLRMSDTGAGMDADVRERAFDPFFTTKGVGYGTGLGLSSVYGIVDRAGGHAAIHSEPGVGTTFVALLPASLGTPAAAPPELSPPSEPGGDQTILVVEDEAPVRELITRILAGAGYTVLAAAGGPAALELAHAHAGTIDLLLTDVIMPGMLGQELAERLRAARPGLRSLYMSGFSEWMLGQTTAPAPVALLEKPFTAAALLARVHAACDERTTT